MFDRSNGLFLPAACLALGLGVAGFATAGGDKTAAAGPPDGATAPAESATNDTDPVRCEIVARPVDGAIALVGVVHADSAIAGSYAFRVVSAGAAGSSDIAQGGAFTAGPNAPATLGSVMIGSAGAGYRATLEITADGRKVSCAEQIGGAI